MSGHHCSWRSRLLGDYYCFLFIALFDYILDLINYNIYNILRLVSAAAATVVPAPITDAAATTSAAADAGSGGGRRVRFSDSTLSRDSLAKVAAGISGRSAAAAFSTLAGASCTSNGGGKSSSTSIVEVRPLGSLLRYVAFSAYMITEYLTNKMIY